MLTPDGMLVCAYMQVVGVVWCDSVMFCASSVLSHTPSPPALLCSSAPPLPLQNSRLPYTSTSSSTQQCQLPHTTALAVLPVMLQFFSSEPSAQSGKWLASSSYAHREQDPVSLLLHSRARLCCSCPMQDTSTMALPLRALQVAF